MDEPDQVVDNDAPTLVSMSLSTAGGCGQSITAAGVIEDDSTAIASTSLVVRLEGQSASLLLHGEGSTTHAGELFEFSLRYDLSARVRSGRWLFEELRLRDGDGAERVYEAGARGLPSVLRTLEVTTDCADEDDSAGPVLNTAPAAAPASVAPGGAFTLSGPTTTTTTGLGWVRFSLRPAGDDSAVVRVICLDPTPESATYTCQATVPPDGPSGDWHVDRVWAFDRAGNGSSTARSELSGALFDFELEVTD